jgi:hypothetical protein
MVNDGVVAFELIKAAAPTNTEQETRPTYMIDPNSINAIYGGFH